MLPKAEGGASVVHADAKLAVREAIGGLPDGHIKIFALATETAASLFVTGTFAGSSARLTGLTWGAEDLSAELGAAGEPRCAGPLSRSLSAGAGAVSRRRRRRQCAGARHRLCRFPQQRRFSPRMRGSLPRRLYRQDGDPSGAGADHQRGVHAERGRRSRSAQSIIDAFAQNPGAGVVGIGGVMYDRPHLARAKRLLAQAAPIKS